MTQSLKQLENSITNLLNKRYENTLSLGDKLTQANAQFEKKGDFIDWAEVQFSLKKAQVYKWMKVYRDFGVYEEGSSPWEGVAMRVLYAIASSPIVGLREACEQALSDGATLDSQALRNIEASMVPEKAPPKAPPLELIEADEDKPTSTPASDDASDNPDQPAPEHVDEIRTYLNVIEGLNDTILELKEQLKPKPKQEPAALKDLPQFDSSEPNVVLGLSLVDASSDKAIKTAHRALASLYKKATNPIAAEKLLDARNTLLEEL